MAFAAKIRTGFGRAREALRRGIVRATTGKLSRRERSDLKLRDTLHTTRPAFNLGTFNNRLIVNETVGKIDGGYYKTKTVKKKTPLGWVAKKSTVIEYDRRGRPIGKLTVKRKKASQE